MHQCPGNWVAIGPVLMYYARAADTFSAGIKCWHCISHLAHILSQLFIFPRKLLNNVNPVKIALV